MAQLRAIFEMAEDGPTYVKGKKYKHYAIILSVVDAPTDALTMIYSLDETYTNPVRMVTKGVPNFQEYITAYSDYTIRIMYRPLEDPNKLQPLMTQKLSDALTASYGRPVPDALRLAINDITSH